MNNNSGRVMTDTKKQPSQGRLAVYDGVNYVGYVDPGRGGLFRAYDAVSRVIGAFKTRRDAMRAIPKAVS